MTVIFQIEAMSELDEISQWLSKRKRHSLCVRNTDQERTNEARAARYGNTFQLIVSHRSTGQCSFNNGYDLIQMLTRREFRLDSAIRTVQINLRRNYARVNLIAVAHNGRSCLVTRRFDSKN